MLPLQRDADYPVAGAGMWRRGDCRCAQVTILNPKVIVHACKLKVDGITKYLENQAFEFDHVRRHCALYSFTALPSAL
jgi:hypothetical protein